MFGSIRDILFSKGFAHMHQRYRYNHSQKMFYCKESINRGLHNIAHGHLLKKLQSEGAGKPLYQANQQVNVATDH